MLVLELFYASKNLTYGSKQTRNSESVYVTPAEILKNILLARTCKIFMQIKMLQSPTFQFDIWQSKIVATLISWINGSHQWKNRDHLEHGGHWATD